MELLLTVLVFKFQWMCEYIMAPKSPILTKLAFSFTDEPAHISIWSKFKSSSPQAFRQAAHLLFRYYFTISIFLDRGMSVCCCHCSEIPFRDGYFSSRFGCKENWLDFLLPDIIIFSLCSLLNFWCGSFPPDQLLLLLYTSRSFAFIDGAAGSGLPRSRRAPM